MSISKDCRNTGLKVHIFPPPNLFVEMHGAAHSVKRYTCILPGIDRTQDWQVHNNRMYLASVPVPVFCILRWVSYFRKNDRQRYEWRCKQASKRSWTIHLRQRQTSDIRTRILVQENICIKIVACWAPSDWTLRYYLLLRDILRSFHFGFPIPPAIGLTVFSFRLRCLPVMSSPLRASC